MKQGKISGPARTIAFVCSAALVMVLFLPLWRIELNAPQYPEGLVLKIWPGKLGGDVDIVNGLNHYIGMKTLHANDFIEFTVLPYIIGGLALLSLLVGILGKRKFFYVFTVLFLIVAVESMIDFYKWEYDYGHNLNPDAPIKVPGMAYQPPLIGFKQLLNFGAYSIPDAGGWIFIGVSVLLVTGSIVEWRKVKQSGLASAAAKGAAAMLVFITVSSCQGVPAPIRTGIDNCDFCKMTVADARFGGELITLKGKIYKFDDMHCLLSFMKAGTVPAAAVKNIYLVDFSGTHTLLRAENAFLYKSEDLRSPMGGNIAVFAAEDSLKKMQDQMKGTPEKWNNLIQ
jgi:copper chaperone NosL